MPIPPSVIVPPNKLTAIAQGPPMIISNASNMTTALAGIV
jgi:hypothetical protein